MNNLPRSIPADARPVEETSLGAAYVYESNGKLFAIGWKGKAGRPAFHYRFQSEERHTAYIQEFFSGLAAHKLRADSYAKQRRAPHPLAIGDIVYNSWGYDQTNIDFYEVVKVSPNYVWLRERNSRTATDGALSFNGRIVPAEGFASEDVTKHAARADGHIVFRHGAGCKWEGQPLHCSWGH